MICFGSGALIGVPLFFALKSHTGVSTAAICMILVMLPFFLFAMYERNGQPKQTAELQKYAAACEARADEIFQEMGIPESYLVDGDLDALSDLMESELLSSDCGDCPGCCLCDEDCGYAGTCPTEDRDTAIRASMQEILEAVGEVLDAAEEVMRRIGDGN